MNEKMALRVFSEKDERYGEIAPDGVDQRLFLLDVPNELTLVTTVHNKDPSGVLGVKVLQALP